MMIIMMLKTRSRFHGLIMSLRLHVAGLSVLFMMIHSSGDSSLQVDSTNQLQSSLGRVCP